ncbi:MAG TPA: hypothetical protein VN829_21085 [Dongiaceae bacterium]|nr:hypothetical protein [Dongiaceae bacterium]
MKRKLAALGAFVLLVGAFGLLRWFSRPGSLALDSPPRDHWTLSAPLPVPATNTATVTNGSQPVK